MDELPLLGVMDRPVFLPEEEVERINSEKEAIATCWAYRRTKYTQKAAAAMLEINQGVFSQALNGERNLPPGTRIAFQWLCGNWALTQYEMKEAQAAMRINQCPKRRASDWGGRRGEPMRATA